VVVPGKEVVANYLEQYTVEMDPPVRMQTRVDRLEARVDGGFIAYLGTEAIGCDNVVVATGSFGRTPQFPEFGDRLDPGIQQVHSTGYRRPSELAPGPTLVVGASHTGCDIAYEVAADRPTFLVGPDRDRSHSTGTPR
jgi:putative flavoprotein involved in K+ transport